MAQVFKTGIQRILGRVLVGIWEEGEGGGGGMDDNREGKTFVFRQILVSFAQLSDPLSPSTVREKRIEDPNQYSRISQQNMKKTVESN